MGKKIESKQSASQSASHPTSIVLFNACLKSSVPLLLSSFSPDCKDEKSVSISALKGVKCSPKAEKDRQQMDSKSSLSKSKPNYDLVRIIHFGSFACLTHLCSFDAILSPQTQCTSF